MSTGIGTLRCTVKWPTSGVGKSRTMLVYEDEFGVLVAYDSDAQLRPLPDSARDIASHDDLRALFKERVPTGALDERTEDDYALLTKIARQHWGEIGPDGGAF